MSELILSPHAGYRSATTLYAHTDDEKLHQLNKKKYGPSWYYYDRPLTYKFNNYGYRMNKELHEIDYSNHCAFFGCSNTVGIGLELEETFAYRIGEQLGMDYVNGAIGGGSPEFVFYNMTRYLTNVREYPEFIVVNWPQCSRTLFWETDQMHFFLPSVKTEARHWVDSYKEFITEDSHVLQRFHFLRANVRLMCKLADINLIEFTSWQDTEGFFERNPDMILPNIHNYNEPNINTDKARDILAGSDVAHPGTFHQQIIVDHILSRLK